MHGVKKWDQKSNRRLIRRKLLSRSDQRIEESRKEENNGIDVTKRVMGAAETVYGKRSSSIKKKVPGRKFVTKVETFQKTIRKNCGYK